MPHSCGRTNDLLDLIAGSAVLRSTLEQAEPMPSYLWYIPKRLGHNKVLDSAVDLVFNATANLLTPPDEDKMLPLMKKYGQALAYLRSAIEDPVESMSVDTLAAVALLASWEVRGAPTPTRLTFSR